MEGIKPKPLTRKSKRERATVFNIYQNGVLYIQPVHPKIPGVYYCDCGAEIRATVQSVQIHRTTKRHLKYLQITST